MPRLGPLDETVSMEIHCRRAVLIALPSLLQAGCHGGS